jgi:hypothetical protein
MVNLAFIESVYQIIIGLYCPERAHPETKNLSQFSNNLIKSNRHSGVVVYGREYYWGGIIQVGAPVRSPKTKRGSTDGKRNTIHLLLNIIYLTIGNISVRNSTKDYRVSSKRKIHVVRDT